MQKLARRLPLPGEEQEVRLPTCLPPERLLRRVLVTLFVFIFHILTAMLDKRYSRRICKLPREEAGRDREGTILRAGRNPRGRHDSR